MKSVVVDTNILFSMLLRGQGRFRDILFQTPDVRFYCCRFSIVELFKHKQKLLKLSHMTEPDLLESLNVILARLSFYDELSLSNSSIREAFDLCREIDEKDTPFVALVIELNGYLWSGDKELLRGLRRKGFQRIFEP